MTIWISGGGSLTREEEARCLAESIVPMGDASYPDFTAVHSVAGLKTFLRQQDAESPPETLNFQASGLWRFVGEMHPGDLLVMRLSHHREVLLAEVGGPYHYFSGVPDRLHHQRRIKERLRLPLEDFTRRVSLNFPGNAMWYPVENKSAIDTIRKLAGESAQSLKPKIAAGVMALLLLFAALKMLASTVQGLLGH